MLPPCPTILDIGSKDARGCYAFGSPPEGSTVLCADIAAGPGVDIVCDAHDMRENLADNTIDCVVTISTLEHVKKPWIVVDEIYRVLKPGGMLYVNTPWVFPFHADPNDHYRFSHRGLEILCERFDVLESGYNRGPASTMAHLSAHSLAIMLSFNSRMLYGILVDLLKWPLAPFKYLDALLKRHPMAHVVANGAYVVGRKPAMAAD